jgi:hypothetical protein
MLSSETDNLKLTRDLAENPSAHIKDSSSKFTSLTTALAMQVKQASFEQDVHGQRQTSHLASCRKVPCSQLLQPSSPGTLLGSLHNVQLGKFLHVLQSG